ncbi:MAG: phage protein with motif [Clostridia bacterium]|jgi:transcriptional regulator with XRE-family HTH domain|nr:phage protein with motif [Clostridia bacterium]
MKMIKKYREQKKISQRELGRRIGLSGQYIAKLEKDENANPTKETLQKIADELDVSVSELFEEEKFAEDIQKSVIYDFLKSIGYVVTDCTTDETNPIIQISKETSKKKTNLSSTFKGNDILNLENDILSYIEYLVYRHSRRD